LTEQVLAERSEPERRVLSALAVPMGASVGKEHLSTLARVADSHPALDSLQRRGLVQAHSPRYSLTGSLDEALREEWDLTPWQERALEYFATWAEEQRHAPDGVLEEADAILGVLHRAAQEGSWEGALRLGRAVEGPLAVRGHWGAWAETLERELEAARQLGDRAAEAWALHQSGTRALCLEDAPTARADLAEALRLRESLGDWEGAAVTRHNLNLLGGFGGDQGPEGNGSGGGAGASVPWLPIIGAIVVVALLTLVGAALGAGELNPLSGNETPQGVEQPQQKEGPQQEEEAQQNEGPQSEERKAAQEKVNGTNECLAGQVTDPETGECVVAPPTDPPTSLPTDPPTSPPTDPPTSDPGCCSEPYVD
jgi:cytochrome b